VSDEETNHQNEGDIADSTWWDRFDEENARLAMKYGGQFHGPGWVQ
jgi:hypothetical protein